MGGRLPTFVTIGTMKGGTIALRSYLGEHPEIVMSKVKETDYFFRPERHGHDLDWYRGQFTGAGEQFGDSSPNYTKRHLDDGVVDRMAALLPEARLIFLARDPIERTVSHFLHNVHRGRTDLSRFDRYVSQDHRGTVVTSRYGYQLEPYLAAYGRERILVLASEDLRNDRLPTLRRVFTFLGVDPDFVSPKFDVDRHVTAKKLAEEGMSTVRPELSSDQRARLADLLRPDIERFRAMTGQDFAHWSI